jgi:integrase
MQTECKPDARIIPRCKLTLRRWMHQLGLVANVDTRHRCIHSLRHYCGTRLNAETENLQNVKAHLGHTNLATTEVYAEWSAEGAKRALAEW